MDKCVVVEYPMEYGIKDIGIGACLVSNTDPDDCLVIFKSVGEDMWDLLCDDGFTHKQLNTQQIAMDYTIVDVLPATMMANY